MKRFLAIVLMALLFLPAGTAYAAKGGGGGKPDGDKGGGGKGNGVCNAYFRGSERGREKKSEKGKAFQRLEAAAAALGLTVDEFCKGTTPPATCARGFGDNSGLPILTEPGTILNEDENETGPLSEPIHEDLEPLDPTAGLLGEGDPGAIHEVNCTVVITVEEILGL